MASLWIDRSRIRQAKEDGQADAVRKEVESATRKLLRQQPELLGPDYIALLEAVGKAKRISQKPYAFITINPFPDVEPIEFEDCVERIVNKKWIRDIYSYSYERDDKDRLHVHMIVYRGNKPKSEIIREIYNVVKDIVGDKACIDVENIAQGVRKVYDYCHKSCPNDEKHESEKFFDEYFILDNDTDTESQGDT